MRLFGVSDEVVGSALFFKPILAKEGNSIVNRVFQHLLSFQRVHALLKCQDLNLLKARQKDYWAKLFECRFDGEYLQRVRGVAAPSLRKCLPIEVFVASQSLFEGEALRLAQIHFTGDRLAKVSSAITRIVYLDTAIASKFYIREATRPPVEKL